MRLLLGVLFLAACAPEPLAPTEATQPALAGLEVDSVQPPPALFMLHVSDPLVEAGTGTIAVTGADPGADVRVLWGTTPGPGPCAGPLCADIADPALLYAWTADASGFASATTALPASVRASDPLVFQAVVVNGASSYKSGIELRIVVPPRCPTVDTSDMFFSRIEGLGASNLCLSDSDCVVGGCSAEVCAAEPVPTTCEGLPYGPTGTCGCVDSECFWNDPC